MSSASSAVTYNSVYTDSEPGRVFWGADEELSDGGSSHVIMYGYDRLPMLPVAPPSLNYIPCLEELQTPPVPQDEDEHEPMFIQPHDPDFMPEPIYPEYIPLKDKHILPAEEQPLPLVVSPTAESPGYVAESDPEEDPAEYEDDETEDGPVDYPMDGGDDGNEDDSDSSGDNAGDEDENKEDDEEEEEHLALADSAVVIPTDELVSPHEETKPVAISFPPEVEFERLLATPTPSPSPLTTLSPPSVGERLARCTASAALPSPPLPPPLHMPLPIDCRDYIPEIEMPPRKRLCLSTLGFRYEVRESSTARPTGGQGIDYGFVSTLDAEARRRGIGEVGVTKLAELHEHDTQDLYALFEDARDSRTRISQRVTVDSQRVDLLMKDKIAHQETIQIVEDKAYATREAWAHSIGLSRAVHSEHQTHKKQVYAYEFQLQTHQTQLQLQSTLIQTHHQLQIMAPVTKQGPSTLPKNTNPNNMTLQSIQAMIYQSLLRNSTNGDGATFVADETEKIDKYISGLPDNIYGSVKASKPKTLDETIELANDLMDQKLSTYAERQSNNKRKADESFRNNHGHQQQAPKRKNVSMVYNMGTCEKKPYSRNLPKSSGNTHVANAQRNNGINPKGNGCFKCGATRHFKRDCPKLKNKDGEKGNAPGWVYAVGNAEKRENASRDLDLNVIMGNSCVVVVGNKMQKAFPLQGESSYWQYKFPLPVEGVPTARRMEIPLPGVCTAMMKKLPVKDKWQLH
nr:hypothetical protein [Tanacetum cinerariifolium]